MNDSQLGIQSSFYPNLELNEDRNDLNGRKNSYKEA